MNQLNILILSGICLALIGCSDSTTPESSTQTEEVEKETSTYVYQKPGAAIRFDHNYDGRTETGETENLTLFFSEGYPAGTLSITVDSDAGLEYSTDSSTDFDLQSAEQHQMSISLSAQAPGRYYLRIFAEVLLPEGNTDRRVFGLALNVGDSANNASNVKGKTETDFRGEELIMLPADENQKN